MSYECDNDNHDIGCQCPGLIPDPYPPVKGLPAEVETYERYEVYVDSGRANELFLEFCKSLGDSIDKSWKDTEEQP